MSKKKPDFYWDTKSAGDPKFTKELERQMDDNPIRDLARAYIHQLQQAASTITGMIGFEIAGDNPPVTQLYLQYADKKYYLTNAAAVQILEYCPSLNELSGTLVRGSLTPEGKITDPEILYKKIFTGKQQAPNPMDALQAMVRKHQSESWYQELDDDSPVVTAYLDLVEIIMR